MTQRGISSPIILAIVGALIIIGALVLPNRENDGGTVPADQTTNNNGDSVPGTSEPDGDGGGTPAPPAPQAPSVPATPPKTPPAPPSGSDGANASELPPTATTPPPLPEPVSPPAPPPTASYDPGFKADSRVTPEIPSENERAVLPSCGNLLPIELVELSNISNITPAGTFGSSSNPPSYAVLDFGTSGEFNVYDVFAPGDVYVTNIVQENGITADSEDTTIYFALCKDVVGYVTNIKEMSAGIFKMVTDSYCFGKPHTGPNACKIEILEQVSRGSLLGKAGKLEGKLGFGMIDLRENRNLTNPAQYSIKTNFAVCPFDYLLYSSGFYAKMSSGNDLCAKP